VIYHKTSKLQKYFIYSKNTKLYLSKWHK